MDTSNTLLYSKIFPYELPSTYHLFQQNLNQLVLEYLKAYDTFS